MFAHLVGVFGFVAGTRPVGGNSGAFRGDYAAPVPEFRQGLAKLAQLGAAVVLLVCMVGVQSAKGIAAHGLPAMTPPSASERRGDAEYLYRIIGKVRFLFFWLGADDVGGARIAWRGDDRDRAVSLLIGSEPQRAPRKVNEWGYVREGMAGDFTTTFGIRTVTDGDSPDEAEARRRQAGGLAEFGVICSTVSPVEATSQTTSIYVPRDATYRQIDRVLAVLEGNARWKERRTPRPSEAAPGFLTALDRLMWSSATARGAPGSIPEVSRLSYVYKDAVYDLTARRVERLSQLRTRSGVLRNLLRTEFSVRNRTTGWTTDFRVTYGTEGPLAGVPVHAQYQPNWWFRVELELDEGADVPPDPSSEASILQRIETLCQR